MKAVKIPILEQCHVKAHMRRCEPAVGFNIGEKCIHVADVIHDLKASFAGAGIYTGDGFTVMKCWHKWDMWFGNSCSSFFLWERF